MIRFLFIICSLIIAQNISAQSIRSLSIPDNIYINDVVETQKGYGAATNHHFIHIEFLADDQISVEFDETNISVEEFTSILHVEQLNSYFVACKKGVYSTVDFDSWSKEDEGLGTKSCVDLKLLNEKVYVLSKASGIYRLDNNNWIKLDSAWGGSWAYNMVAYEAKLYVACGKGVFVSDDEAKSFQHLNNGLNYTVKTLFVNEEVLFAGTSGHGFYSFDFKLEKWNRESDNIDNIDVNTIALVDGRGIIGCEPNSEGYSLFWSDNGFDWQPYEYSEFQNRTIKYICPLAKEGLLLVSTDNGTYLLDPTITSVDDIEIEQISVYPNPTNIQLNINLPNDYSGVAKYQIFDSIGKLLVSEAKLNISQGTAQINLEKFDLKSGIYFCKLTYSSYLHTFNFTVIK
jgi:Secretion system C-terminal sorting domain